MALKVIRLQEEEGTPFTAIREGKRLICGIKVLKSDCNTETDQWNYHDKLILRKVLGSSHVTSKISLGQRTFIQINWVRVQCIKPPRISLVLHSESTGSSASCKVWQQQEGRTCNFSPLHTWTCDISPSHTWTCDISPSRTWTCNISPSCTWTCDMYFIMNVLILLAKFHIHKCKFISEKTNFISFLHEVVHYVNLISGSNNRKTVKTVNIWSFSLLLITYKPPLAKL